MEGTYLSCWWHCAHLIPVSLQVHETESTFAGALNSRTGVSKAWVLQLDKQTWGKEGKANRTLKRKTGKEMAQQNKPPCDHLFSTSFILFMKSTDERRKKEENSKEDLGNRPLHSWQKEIWDTGVDFTLLIQLSFQDSPAPIWGSLYCCHVTVLKDARYFLILRAGRESSLILQWNPSQDSFLVGLKNWTFVNTHCWCPVQEADFHRLNR